MPERTGSLATRTTIVVGAGLGVVAAVVGTGGWWLADRALDTAAASQVDPAAAGDPAADAAILRWTIVGGAALLALAGAAVATVFVRREVLGPVRQLRETAERVVRGDTSARAPADGHGELRALAEAMNRMLDAAERAQLQLFAMNEALDLKIGELSEANVGLGESNRLKSEFLANVSHELRTPLNSIIGFADLLEEIARSEPAPDPKRLRYIGNIQRSGRSLLDMINSLLDMAKIEAGRMEVTVAPASAADVVEGLQAIMRPLAVQKRIDLQARVADGLPKVETDAGKLQQILYNYLSNAIKFSPEDGAVIVSVARAERNGGEAVRISVTDHGPGIPEDMQETIFEKFRQVDASHTRRAGGTGLGLAICRELADLMGCSVGLVSASGKGSTFWVEVPVVHRPRELKPLMADAAVTRP
jgi:signal transduction histidine kinase